MVLKFGTMKSIELYPGFEYPRLRSAALAGYAAAGNRLLPQARILDNGSELRSATVPLLNVRWMASPTTNATL
jgi:hypothetical protein